MPLFLVLLLTSNESGLRSCVCPGKDKVEAVVSHDIVGRLMIHCARQRGLGKVIEQLVGFEGNGNAQPRVPAKRLKDQPRRFGAQSSTCRSGRRWRVGASTM